MKKMTILVVAIIIYIVSFTGYVHAALNKSNIEYDVYEIVKVKRGETLWNIADRYNDQFGISLVNMLDIIYDFNELDSTIIQPGQFIKIPDLID